MKDSLDVDVSTTTAGASGDVFALLHGWSVSCRLGFRFGFWSRFSFGLWARFSFGLRARFAFGLRARLGC